MTFSKLLTHSLLAYSALAHPIRSLKRASHTENSTSPNIDVTILQFALTLEHLENAFYTQALSQLTQDHFLTAGFGANYFSNVGLIASDEAQHVTFLQGALTGAGASPVQPCTYNFPFTDVNSFIGLSNILEGVGTSAYLGAAPLVTDKTILSAAASIMVTEALHTSLQRVAVKSAAAGNPFGAPLDPNAVFSLAAAFITECPASNAALPFKAFPALTLTSPAACTCEGPDCNPSLLVKRQQPQTIACTSPTSKVLKSQADCDPNAPAAVVQSPAGALCAPPVAGSGVIFTAAQAVAQGSFLTFVSGLTVVSVQAHVQDTTVMATIPDGVSGQSYVMITSADAQGTFDANAVLFGPAILEVQPPV